MDVGLLSIIPVCCGQLVKMLLNQIVHLDLILPTYVFACGAHDASICAAACDFQQCGILTCVDSDEPVQPPFLLRKSKCCSANSLTVIECSSDLERLRSDCARAQAGLRLCWSHIRHCWKSHVTAHLSWNSDTV